MARLQGHPYRSMDRQRMRYWHLKRFIWKAGGVPTFSQWVAAGEPMGRVPKKYLPGNNTKTVRRRRFDVGSY